MNATGPAYNLKGDDNNPFGLPPAKDAHAEASQQSVPETLRSATPPVQSNDWSINTIALYVIFTCVTAIVITAINGNVPYSCVAIYSLAGSLTCIAIAAMVVKRMKERSQQIAQNLTPQTLVATTALAEAASKSTNPFGADPALPPAKTVHTEQAQESLSPMTPSNPAPKSSGWTVNKVALHVIFFCVLAIATTAINGNVPYSYVAIYSLAGSLTFISIAAMVVKHMRNRAQTLAASSEV